MRLGVDTTSIDDGPSGARARLEGLLPALLDHDDGILLTLFLPAGCERPVVPEGSRVRHVATPLRPGRPVRRWLRGRTRPGLVAGDGSDVFLTDYHPVLASPPTLVTIHDLRSLHGIGSRLRAGYFRWRMPALLRRAAGVIVPSRTVATEVAGRLGADPGRIHVVPNAPSPNLSPDGPKEDLGEPYVLHLGPDVPRKNLDVLRLSPVPVVLAGRAPLRASPPFRPVGPVDEDRRARLIRGAAAVVMPALCEGFGLPVVEAFAGGTPVIASRAGALPEVVGDAGALLDPDDAGAWCDAIRAVLGNPDEGREARLARAARYTWSAAANALVGILRVRHARR